VPPGQIHSTEAAVVERRHGRGVVRFTTRGAGDLRVSQAGDVLASRRAAVADLPWTWLHQVHGADVVVVDRPGQHAGVEADAAVTATPGAALAVHTADCAPVALLSDTGVAAVHAGWKGLAAGVVEATVATLRRLTGGDALHAVLGPCIHPECYEFGPAELAQLTERYGPAVQGLTADGAPALDVPAAVRAALRAAGVEDVAAGGDGAAGRVTVVDVCTACDPQMFSHRARQDSGRQAMVVWLDEAG
jgi:YfiH family protein